jgi:hypothetical protein
VVFLLALLLLAAPPDAADSPEHLLAQARDAGQPSGARAQALISYGRAAARRGLGPEAARAVWTLKGQLEGKTDPVFEALGAIGPPALPLLGQVIGQCDTRREREVDDGQMVASLLVAIVRENAGAPEALALAPALVRGLGCADPAVRQLCARALGALARLESRELAAVRTRLRADRRPDTRALAAAILAAAGARDDVSVKALERALVDPAEVVQLASANALLQLKKPARARPVVERLQRSRDPQIAGLAAGVLRSYPAESP